MLSNVLWAFLLLTLDTLCITFSRLTLSCMKNDTKTYKILQCSQTENCRSYKFVFEKTLNITRKTDRFSIIKFKLLSYAALSGLKKNNYSLILSSISFGIKFTSTASINICRKFFYILSTIHLFIFYLFNVCNKNI